MNEGLAFFVGACVGILLILVVNDVFETSSVAYKRGQIDALSGKAIKYQLKTQPDGSTIWVAK